MLEGTFYQELTAPATTGLNKAFRDVLLTESEDWRQPLIEQLNETHQTSDEVSADRMMARARSYTLINRTLYKKGVVEPLLKCISRIEGQELLHEIHSRLYGSHIRARSLSAKAITQGFYWPTHVKDFEHIVKTCEACHKTSLHQSSPSRPTQLIAPTWPLQRWGMDLVATTIPGGNKFAVVAIVYFTRWIEARPLANITSTTVKKFFWQSIVCKFSVPKTLTIDNGKQFDSDLFKQFCQNIRTTLAFASVYHPESNGAIERGNRVVFSAISKTLFSLRKGKWVKDLPTVVMVPQHHNFKNNRVYAIQATLRRRSNVARGNEAPKPPINARNACLR